MVKEQGPLSTARTVSIGIQICHLVHHLHSAKENPILYLDLQPKNLLLCQRTVKLVDFGRAAFFGESGGVAGTPGCAAPEQYAGEEPDERTDIYGIGAVLYFLSEGRYLPPGPSPGIRFAGGPGRAPRRGETGTKFFPGREKSGRRRRKLQRIIRKCLERRREKRYRTAMELAEALEKVGTLFPELSGGKLGGESFPIVVGFAGSGRGVGTTHLAIGMAACLRDRNIPVLYEEKNGAGVVRELLRYFRKNLNRCGAVSIYGLDMRPFLGKNIKLDPGGWQVVIRDLGTDGWQEDQEWDFLVEVRGGKWWNRPSQDLPEPSAVIWNHSLPGIQRLRPEEDHTAVRAPCFPNPFFPGRKAADFYRRIWNLWGIEQKGRKSWAEILQKLRRTAGL